VINGEKWSKIKVIFWFIRELNGAPPIRLSRCDSKPRGGGEGLFVSEM